MRKKKDYFAPVEQQIEGQRWVLSKVSPELYIHSLDVMVRANFMSKSRRHLLIKRMRHILGMTWDEYTKKYRTIIKPPSRPLW